MTHELTASIIARRVEDGPHTPLGKRWSMTGAILNNLETAESDQQRANLQASLARLGTEIPQLQADGGRYVHANHGAAK